MADIDIERKKKSPLPWILGLLALVLILFLLMRSCGGDDTVDETVTVVDTTASQTVAPVAPMPVTDTTAAATGAAAAGAAAGTGWIASVLGGQMAGQTAMGEAVVPATPSDRGFWLEENGQRVYAILAERYEQIKDIDPGQRVRISNARVMAGSESAQIPADVDAEAKATAAQQPYFLLVPASGVEIIAGGNTTAD